MTASIPFTAGRVWAVGGLHRRVEIVGKLAETMKRHEARVLKLTKGYEPASLAKGCLDLG
jgi:hypothetical protein